ncbi:ApbE family lipoprotein (fragment) [uncultured Paludibacter sp.]|uniref:FAD:protein FMN transferase n=1 Tax=uncultured Paludibacter sp. TaxID=497635 RepID=A0A653AA55_9BACT
MRTDTDFEEMYAVAKKVSEKTDGAFDITVAPLVNAWGFGYGNHNHSIKPNVDTIMPFVGYKKIKLENHCLIKEDKRTCLDANALAPGQASDVIAKLLEEKGSENYLIEIGGEINCKGLNPKGEKWRIGIDKPVDDPANENEELQAILEITNVSLATSGNYRDYYYQDGKKYSHTVNPHTGLTVEHGLLSVTVIAPTCIEADAYATACMVLGIEGSLKLCESVPNLECYLIYADKNGQYKTVQTKGFEKYFVK